MSADTPHSRNTYNAEQRQEDSLISRRNALKAGGGILTLAAGIAGVNELVGGGGTREDSADGSGSSGSSDSSGAAGAPADATPTDTATPTETADTGGSGNEGSFYSEDGEFSFEVESGEYPYILTDAEDVFDEYIRSDEENVFYLAEDARDIGYSTFDRYGWDEIRVEDERTFTVLIDDGDGTFYGIAVVSDEFISNGLSYTASGTYYPEEGEFHPFGVIDKDLPANDKYLVDTGWEDSYGIVADMSDFIAAAEREDVPGVSFEVHSSFPDGYKGAMAGYGG